LKRATIAAALGFFALTVGACAGNSPQAADTDITILTTDLEALPMGQGEQCIDRLSKVVGIGYLGEHGVTVKDEDAAMVAIGRAIPEVCEKGPADLSLHGGAHRVIAIVEAG